jgi:hypothetical protein
MGVSLLVPSPALAAAKTVLANARPATDDASAAGDDD